MKPQVVQLARQLIAFPSVSSASNVPISEHVASLLEGGGFDEWVEIDQLHRAVELYTCFIDHLCVRKLP